MSLFFAARGLGRLGDIIEFFSTDILTSQYDAIVFSSEGSTILDDSFLISRGINVPQTNIRLLRQVIWSIQYVNSNICTNARG